MSALRLLILVFIVACTAQIASAFEVPAKSEIVDGCYRATAEERLRQKHLDEVEGIWYYPDERLTLAVERIEDSPLATYRMALVDSDNKALDKGVVVGYIQTTAEKDRLRMWLYSLRNDGRLLHPVECVADLKDDRHMRIYKKKLKLRVSVNLSRFLPSVFGGGVRLYPYVKDNESINPGMVKIWPAETEKMMIF